MDFVDISAGILATEISSPKTGRKRENRIEVGIEAFRRSYTLKSPAPSASVFPSIFPSPRPPRRRDASRRTAPHRPSSAGGRAQSGANPVDRRGDTGIRQREHVVLIFRISVRFRLALSLFYICLSLSLSFLFFPKYRVSEGNSLRSTHYLCIDSLDSLIYLKLISFFFSEAKTHRNTNNIFE